MNYEKFWKTHSLTRVAFSSFAVLLLTQSLHAYSPTTALATQGTDATATLSTIQGASFDTSTDSLHVLSAAITNIQVLVGLLVANAAINPVSRAAWAALSNPVITTPVTSSSTAPGAAAALNAYNTALGTATSACTTATTASTESLSNTSAAITAVNNAITAFNTLTAIWTVAGGVNDRPSSTYEAAIISSALSQLAVSLTYLYDSQLS